MKIGVVTYWNSMDNYGQVLQCYALQQYLISKGHQAFLIRFIPRKTAEVSTESPFRSFIHILLACFSKKRKRIYAENESIQKAIQYNRDNNNKREFDRFRRENICMSERIYDSIEELKQNPPEAEVYICGSDQIWNNSLDDKNVGVWYLNFGDCKIRRIAYAASIGREISACEQDTFVQYLQQFNYISTREETSCTYCKNLGFSQTELVMDPTFLPPFSVYSRFIKTNKDTEYDYIFLYYINISTSDEAAWPEIECLSKDENLRIKVVCSSGYLPAMNIIPQHQYQFQTIPEWLTSIYNAKYIITTSFHGVVFSLMMHKPFVVIPLRNHYKAGNNRIQTLLTSVGLSDRILSVQSNLASILHRSINWKDVDSKLNTLRQQSEQYLLTALAQ